MDNAHLNWAILLIAIALVLFFIEFIVPSGGILAVCAFFSLAAGIFFLYKVDTTLGLIGAIVSVGSLPFLVALGIKIMPSTPLYRRLLLKDVPREGMGEHGIAGGSGKERAATLVGEVGQAVTDLRPGGICLINGERMDCLSVTGQVVKSSTKVRVVFADGIQIKVKAEE